MKNTYLESNILNIKIITTIVNSKNLMNIFKKYLDNEKIIDSSVVKRNIRNIKNSLIINPNIFLNLKSEHNICINKVIEDLSVGIVNEEEYSLEFISGVETLKAIENSENMHLIINLSINIDTINKEHLIDNLNAGLSKRTLLNRKLELNVLDEDFIFLYDFLKNLNTNELSPIKDRIDFYGEKNIKGKLKPDALIKCIKEAKLLDIINPNDTETLSKFIINILTAYKISFKDLYTNRKTPIIKICDIRYALSLSMAFYKYCKNMQIALTIENLCNIFELIKKEDLNLNETYNAAMKFETCTKALIKSHSRIILNKCVPIGYNPFDNI